MSEKSTATEQEVAGRPSDIMNRQDHPYDDGYWLRYDDVPRTACKNAQSKNGWDDCDEELMELNKAPKDA